MSSTTSPAARTSTDRKASAWPASSCPKSVSVRASSAVRSSSAHAERLLQRRDAVGERRLRDALRRGGARVRAVLGDAEQVDQALRGREAACTYNQSLMASRHIRIGHYGCGGASNLRQANRQRQPKARKTMPGRDVHLVGSVPMANAEEVFGAVSAALGPHASGASPTARPASAATGSPGSSRCSPTTRHSRSPASSSASTRAARARALHASARRHAADVRFDNLSTPTSPAPTRRSAAEGRRQDPPGTGSRSTWCRRIR